MAHQRARNKLTIVLKSGLRQSEAMTLAAIWTVLFDTTDEATQSWQHVGLKVTYSDDCTKLKWIKSMFETGCLDDIELPSGAQTSGAREVRRYLTRHNCYQPHDMFAWLLEHVERVDIAKL